MRRTTLIYALTAVVLIAAAAFTVGLLLPPTADAATAGCSEYEAFEFYESWDFNYLLGVRGEDCCGVSLDWGIQTGYYKCAKVACYPCPPDS